MENGGNEPKIEIKDILTFHFWLDLKQDLYYFYKL